jgi:hypothetical protein
MFWRLSPSCGVARRRRSAATPPPHALPDDEIHSEHIRVLRDRTLEPISKSNFHAKHLRLVIPANAAIQFFLEFRQCWIPAFAGMTAVNVIINFEIGSTCSRRKACCK